ncbi:HNH endonuclease signature motif containing protein [Streptomyces sp. NPDC091212]|uniref:HNH endonuclease n=1 Tax=Streptomyces sp. NPDC091212 TaxID=3155191 RepID=UPI00343B45A5
MSGRKGDWLRGETHKAVRNYVAGRDGRCCFYCRVGFPEDLAGVTLDHFIPYSVWPMSKPRNLVLACQPCNRAKEDALPVVFAWVLLRHYRYEVAA